MEDFVNDEVKPKRIASIVLFLSSYIPLFLLLIIKQVKEFVESENYIKCINCNKPIIAEILNHFVLSIFLGLVIIIAFCGLRIFLKNLQKNINNGQIVKISKIENKNNESIAYIATYIVPFMFQSTNNIFDLFSLFIVFAFIFLIYIKSNMIVINPILNMTHTLLYIEFMRGNKRYYGFLITSKKNLNIDSEVKINQFYGDIYYG